MFLFLFPVGECEWHVWTKFVNSLRTIRNFAVSFGEVKVMSEGYKQTCNV